MMRCEHCGKPFVLELCPLPQVGSETERETLVL